MTHHEVGEMADLVELSKLSLAHLKELDDSVLAHALRHVLAGSDEPDTSVAAFASYLDGQE